MSRPLVHGVARVRPTRPFLKQLKYAWKPPPTKEQVYWGRHALSYLRHKAPDLRPDAFLSLSELVASRYIPLAEVGQIQEWVKDDHMCRFELKNELERVEGREGCYTNWLIRAKEFHSIPGVSNMTQRIENPGSIGSLIFATAPGSWPRIEEYGLFPDIPNFHTPKEYNKNFTYFAKNLATLLPPYFNTYPAPHNAPDDQLIQLHIHVDVCEAMEAGIKFFRDKDGQIISTGLPNCQRKSIPSQFFNSVFVVALKREFLATGQEAGP